MFSHSLLYLQVPLETTFKKQKCVQETNTFNYTWETNKIEKTENKQGLSFYLFIL